MANQAHIGIMFASFVMGGYTKEHGIYETLRKIREIGYNYIEVSQMAMTDENIAELKRGCDDFNIKVRSFTGNVHAYESIQKWGPAKGLDEPEEFKKMVDICHMFGCQVIRQGSISAECIGNLEECYNFCRMADEVALKLKAEGIGLYFHAHNIEMTKIDGKPLLYLLKDNTKELGFEIDSFWMQIGGKNPETVIRDFKGRVRLLHLKDYRIAPATDFFDIMDFKTGKFGLIQFAEVGEGNLDMPGIINAGQECGCEYFFIEQDNTYGRTAVECAQTSYDNLVKMGFKALLD